MNVQPFESFTAVMKWARENKCQGAFGVFLNRYDRDGRLLRAVVTPASVHAMPPYTVEYIN